MKSVAFCGIGSFPLAAFVDQPPIGCYLPVLNLQLASGFPVTGKAQKLRGWAGWRPGFHLIHVDPTWSNTAGHFLKARLLYIYSSWLQRLNKIFISGIHPETEETRIDLGLPNHLLVLARRHRGFVSKWRDLAARHVSWHRCGETIGFLGLQVLTHDSILLTHMELRVYSDILHNMYNSLLEIQWSIMSTSHL